MQAKKERFGAGKSPRGHKQAGGVVFGKTGTVRLREGGKILQRVKRLVVRHVRHGKPGGGSGRVA